MSNGYFKEVRFITMNINTKEFKAGIKDGIPICLGYFSVSMAFGVSAVKLGMPVWLAVLMSLTNLTSAGQFAGTTLLTSGGAYIELIITMLIINARYFLMSLSVSQKVNSRFTVPKRLFASYGITDEIFAVSMQKERELSFTYMVGLIMTPVLGWTLGTLTGAVATSLLPEILSDAMGIALYGMFIAIIIPPARDNINVLFAVLMAIAGSCIFAYVPFLQNISGGWSVIIITVITSMLAAVMFPIAEKEGE